MDPGRTWQQWEVAPAGVLPAEPGPWRHDSGRPLHGVWGRRLDSATELVVAANTGYALGRWVVPAHRWSAVSPLCSITNAYLPATPWVWGDRRTLRRADAAQTALALVAARRRPLCRLETPDEATACSWAATARSAGLFVREQPPAGSSRATWVVEAAVDGTFADLFDLPVLLDTLIGCGLGLDQARAAGEALAEIGPATVPDVLGEEWLDWAQGTPATIWQGLALGHHPALVAGRLLGLAAQPVPDDAQTEALLVTLGVAAAPAPLPGLAGSVAVAG